MIKAVLFDFGNVLYWFDYDRFFNTVAPYSPFDAARLRELLFGGSDPVSHQYETGRMSTSGFFDWARTVAKIGLAEDAIRDAFVGIFSENTHVTQIVESLAERMPVGLVSNTNEVHYEYFMRRTPVFSRFAAVGTSFHAGVMKPAASIFQGTLAQLACKPEQCIFVDDLEENVDAARALGMHGVHYGNETDLIETLQAYGVDATSL